MTRIYIIRHAEAEGNLYRRAHGRYDGKITDTGMKQIAALERRFRDIPVDAAYASPLLRTKTTARAVTVPKGLELKLEPGLVEISMGCYEDKPFGELRHHHPRELSEFFHCSPLWKPEGGESYAQVALRAADAVRRIAKAHPDQTVALFTHSCTIRALQAALRGKHPGELELGHCENTGVTLVEADGDRVRIVFENDASHLPFELSSVAQRQRSADNPAGPIRELWYRPLDLETEGKLYYDARKEAWEEIYGSLLSFDGTGFLDKAREQLLFDHRAVQCAMDGDRVAGILQLATLRGAGEGVGHISFLYLMPEYRRRGIGVQLIGQAVSTYRAMGREKLHLSCSPQNQVALRFYQRCGFTSIGSVPGARLPLELLEMEL